GPFRSKLRPDSRSTLAARSSPQPPVSRGRRPCGAPDGPGARRTGDPDLAACAPATPARSRSSRAAAGELGRRRCSAPGPDTGHVRWVAAGVLSGQDPEPRRDRTDGRLASPPEPHCGPDLSVGAAAREHVGGPSRLPCGRDPLRPRRFRDQHRRHHGVELAITHPGLAPSPPGMDPYEPGMDGRPGGLSSQRPPAPRNPGAGNPPCGPAPLDSEAPIFSGSNAPGRPLYASGLAEAHEISTLLGLSQDENANPGRLPSLVLRRRDVRSRARLLADPAPELPPVPVPLALGRQSGGGAVGDLPVERSRRPASRSPAYRGLDSSSSGLCRHSLPFESHLPESSRHRERPKGLLDAGGDLDLSVPHSSPGPLCPRVCPVPAADHRYPLDRYTGHRLATGMGSASQAAP